MIRIKNSPSWPEAVNGHPRGNPFSTRYVRPGSQEFLFPAGEDADQLVEKLRQAHWRGQVIGPHGAGKSTLLQTLRPILQQAERTLVWLTLRDGQRHLPKDLLNGWDAWDSQVLVIVDGYEQLGWHARWRLNRRCRQAGSGLLVTSHANTGLPPVYEVRPSLPIVHQLVARLMEDHPGALGSKEVADRFQAWDGNVREVLFALYDLYEMRRRDL